jgi:curved DNA-binding protein CbpA
VSEAAVKLHRLLVKRLHPDLSQDPTEVRRREELIKDVNRAWTDKDLETLRRMEEQSR